MANQRQNTDRQPTANAEDAARAAASGARRRYLAQTYNLTDEQVDVIRNQICIKATDSELEHFMMTAKRMRLDPFAKQILFIKRKQKTEDDRGEPIYIDVGRPEVTIDGLRACAEQTGEYDGQSPTEWCGEDGLWRDVWLHHEPPMAARVTIHRKGMKQSITHVALFDEYQPPRLRNGDLPGMWRKMPANQIAKCAEAGAFRKAFPRDMSGVNIPEEMEGASLAAATYTAPPNSAEHAAREPAETAPSQPALPERGDGAIVSAMLLTIRDAKTRDDLEGIAKNVSAAKHKKDPASATICDVVAPALSKRWNELPPRGR